MKIFATALAMVAVLTSFPARYAYAQPTDAERVEAALQEAVQYLLRDQNRTDGRWTEVPQFPLGVTGLCTLALLYAGEDPDSKAIRLALQRLEGQQANSTYAISLQTMVFCYVNPNRYAASIEANSRWLADTQLSNGGWTYGKRGEQTYSPGGDGSNSQFALLALHEAQRTGLGFFEPEQWQLVFGKARRYWEELQNADGSFAYDRAGSTGRGSMTAAGIASLAIVGAQLGESQSSASPKIQCCGAALDGRDRIAEATAWLAKTFSVSRNPGFGKDQLYYLYALERAGRLTGQRYIGDYDWYREGASTILRQQQPGGVVRSVAGSTGGNPYSDTAFAILFLAKGKRRIVVSRLEHGATGDWNRHPGAMQNITSHTERAWKQDLAWQNINLRKAKLEDLLETPVLFLSGTQTPRLNQKQKQLLKDYVEQGGFIFAEGCMGDGCNGKEFENFIQSLALELFDKPLSRLPPEHPIWLAEARVTPADLPDDCWLYGVESCCRLGLVYCPSSLSCRWELNPAYGSKRTTDPDIQRELDNFTKIGLNVLAYATGKELKDKLDLVTILEDKGPQTTSGRNTLLLPVLRHNAGADDVPTATTKLLQWSGKELKNVPLDSAKRMISITTSELQEYPIAYMHGRGKLQLSESQRAALKEFLAADGFLFASSICADEEFTNSFRQEMETILGEPLEKLPSDAPMLTEAFGGFDIRTVGLIDPQRVGDSLLSTKQQISPRLEIGRVNRRIGVVFSPIDISCSLESRHSLQCRGYVRDDAARLGMNVLLFAFQQP
jgi:hypothetical protein